MPPQVLLNSSWQPKLCDFGLAKIRAQTALQTTPCGEVGDSKFRCLMCRKLFRGPEFVHKHLRERLTLFPAMVSAGLHHTVLLRTDGSAVAFGRNQHGQCDIPALDVGMTYTQAAAGSWHTVLLRSDGRAVAFGENGDGQCTIPPLEEGTTYTQISACGENTVLLRSDGSAVAIGPKAELQCNIPPLDEGLAYIQISGGYSHTVLLRSDGSAVAIGNNGDGQCNIPSLDEGKAYTQVSAGCFHTVLLRSDGSAVAVGSNEDGQCNIPPLDEGLAYDQIAAGAYHTVLLRSDGCAVAVGRNEHGQCNIPALDDGTTYTQISAGGFHTVLLRSDGCTVAFGHNVFGECNISLPEPGICYSGDMTSGRDLALQLEIVGEDDAFWLILSTLVGEERCRLTARGADSAWETHKRIASELKMNLGNLHLVLPDGQLLARVCCANPGASVADVTQSTGTTSNAAARRPQRPPMTRSITSEIEGRKGTGALRSAPRSRSYAAGEGRVALLDAAIVVEIGHSAGMAEGDESAALAGSTVVEEDALGFPTLIPVLKALDQSVKHGSAAQEISL
eukprot:s1897_g12.t1